jgi:hypothetical protein
LDLGVEKGRSFKVSKGGIFLISKKKYNIENGKKVKKRKVS